MIVCGDRGKERGTGAMPPQEKKARPTVTAS